MKKRNLRKVFNYLLMAVGAFIVSVSALIAAPKLNDYIDSLGEEEPTEEVVEDETLDETPEVTE